MKKRTKIPKQKPIERILEKFPDAVKKPNGWYVTECPVCEKEDLLKFRENGKQNVQLKCRKGCLVRDILAEVDLTIRHLYYDGKIPNRNAPKKGAIIRTEPIKKIEDIAKIKELLKNKPRDLCYWVLGSNTNLRTVDLCNLKVKEVQNLTPGDTLTIREKKTGKVRRTPLNTACIDTIQKLLKSKNFKTDDYLLQSNNGSKFSTVYANILIKKWTKTIGLKENYGAHTPRKTWAYHQRVTFGKSLPVIMVALNHSSEAQTLRYISVQSEEVDQLFENLI